MDDLMYTCLTHITVNNQERPSRECQRALAPLVFWSRSLKKSQKVSKSKSRSLEWHQLFLPSFGANANLAGRSGLGYSKAMDCGPNFGSGFGPTQVYL